VSAYYFIVYGLNIKPVRYVTALLTDRIGRKKTSSRLYNGNDFTGVDPQYIIKKFDEDTFNESMDYP